MEQAELIEGGEFSSFQELSKSIKKWEEANFVTLYTSSSRSLESARRRAPRRTGLWLELGLGAIYSVLDRKKVLKVNIGFVGVVIVVLLSYYYYIIIHCK